jgi:hypothetical protein
MKTASDYARYWQLAYGDQAKKQGWGLFCHTGDNCFEIEKIDDPDDIEGETWASDDEVVSHVINHLHDGLMYVIAFYLDRRPVDSECWLPSDVAVL